MKQAFFRSSIRSFVVLSLIVVLLPLAYATPTRLLSMRAVEGFVIKKFFCARWKNSWEPGRRYGKDSFYLLKDEYHDVARRAAKARGTSRYQVLRKKSMNLRKVLKVRRHQCLDAVQEATSSPTPTAGASDPTSTPVFTPSGLGSPTPYPIETSTPVTIDTPSETNTPFPDVTETPLPDPLDTPIEPTPTFEPTLPPNPTNLPDPTPTFTPTPRPTSVRITSIDELRESEIWGQDSSATYLGVISFNPMADDSLSNPQSWSRSSTGQNSIFNPTGQFGSNRPGFPLSAWNPSASSPPRILDWTGKLIAYLTKNPAIGGRRVDPSDLALWLHIPTPTR